MNNSAKIKEWINLYLAHIAAITLEKHVRDEEGYKFKAVDNFQRHFDINAKDLAGMLDCAIENNNLVAGSWYFPRKMLLFFASEEPERTRAALRTLFDQDRPTGERMDIAEEEFDKLIADRNKRLNENKHSFISIRFLSLLLGYRFPLKENALKPREWKRFCRFVDENFDIPRKTSIGAQYKIFFSYTESLRLAIKQLLEIDKIRIKLTEGLDFKDEEFHWMAQDVIYVVSRLIAEGKVGDVGEEGAETEISEDGEDEEEREPATTGERFTFEEDLQNFIEENFENISFGGQLRIYTDSSGRQGLYYPTEYGEIDILAVDENGNYVVFELKRDRAADHVVNQLGRYMQWVEENLALKNNKSVRGIILAHRGSKSLYGAAKALRFPVTIMIYRLRVELADLADGK